MNNEILYQHCRDTVALVRACKDRKAVLDRIGAPDQQLPIGDFFVTHDDLSITYCDSVELYYFNNCAIRIGYVNGKVAKVRGMPIQHWRPPT